MRNFKIEGSFSVKLCYFDPMIYIATSIDEDKNYLFLLQ
jgi:hypothetical protein